MVGYVYSVLAPLAPESVKSYVLDDLFFINITISNKSICKVVEIRLGVLGQTEKKLFTQDGM